MHDRQTRVRSETSQHGDTSRILDGHGAALLAEFNLHPALYAHPSWYTGSISALLRQTDASGAERAERAVSLWLLKRIGLESAFDWTMLEPEKRVFLLDRQALAMLAFSLSLALHASSLRRVVDRAEIRTLEGRIGAAALAFAVETLPADTPRHRIPQVDFGEEALASALVRDGSRVLLSLLKPAWSAVIGRARLKFDRCWSAGMTWTFDSERSAAVLALIRDHIVPRRLPQWAWCF